MGKTRRKTAVRASAHKKTASGRRLSPGSKRRKPNRRRRQINKARLFKAVFVIIVAALIIFAASLVWRFISLPQAPDDGLDFSVRGIDVSSYQSGIDWASVSDQGFAFAFIKATEGSSHVDKEFQKNWEAVNDTTVRAGAYHFLSFESSGASQADNFIKTVEKKRGMLPPVIDLEMYGDYPSNQPDVDAVHAIMDPFIEKIEKNYGMTPIIYTTYHVYKKYVSGYYDHCDIWFSDPDMRQLPDGKSWTFCQYSFEGQLKGADGKIMKIDLNVYRGSRFSWLFY